MEIFKDVQTQFPLIRQPKNCSGTVSPATALPHCARFCPTRAGYPRERCSRRCTPVFPHLSSHLEANQSSEEIIQNITVNLKPSIHANNYCKILTVHINVSVTTGGKRRTTAPFSSCRNTRVYVHSKNLTIIIRMN